MQVGVFECSTRRGTYGFTTDFTGLNLPREYYCEGWWEYIRTIEVERGMFLRDVSADQIVEDIEGIGYHIASGSARIGEDQLKLIP